MSTPHPTDADARHSLEELRARVESDMLHKVELSLDVVREMEPQDIQLLFHELRVHQIELEMQNEELRRTQAELDGSRAHYFDLYDLAPVGYCTVSDTGLLLQTNLTLAMLLGVARSALAAQPLSRFISPQDQDSYYQFRRRFLAGNSVRSCELRMLHGDGSAFWVLVEAMVTADDSHGMRLTVTNINAGRQAQAAQRVSEAALKVISQGVIITGSDMRILSVNAAFMAITGYSEAETLGRNCKFLQGADTNPQTTAAISASLQRHSTFVGEILNYRKDGATFWNELTISPICDAHNNLTHFVGVTRDITERKIAEDALRVLLLEKDALLKEVHHRVKNNLQVITSLLRMESRRSTAEDTKAVLGDMQGRIQAMAQLHESLYMSDTLAAVDLGAYIERLTTLVFQTQGVQNERVRLALNIASVQVSMEQASVCGLLLNELITNCIKHGFPDARSGEVSVSLQPAGSAHDVDDQWCLSVRDTGIGIPINFEERRKASLGMKLVQELSKQLGGLLSIVSAPDLGATFTVTFTMQSPAPLVMPS